MRVLKFLSYFKRMYLSYKLFALLIVVVGLSFFSLPNFSNAAGGQNKITVDTVTLPEMQFKYDNPLMVGSFTNLISHFLAGLQAIIGWLAVIMIVIGGIVYITSAGKSSQLELGKKILTFALLGFAIAVAAPSILKEIMLLAGNGQSPSGASSIAQASGVKVILMRALSFVITLIGVIATIGFVVSGFNFVMAGGDTGRADKARKGLMYSIIGVVVAGGSLIIIRQILILLGMQV